MRSKGCGTLAALGVHASLAPMRNGISHSSQGDLKLRMVVRLVRVPRKRVRNKLGDRFNSGRPMSMRNFETGCLV